MWATIYLCTVFLGFSIYFSLRFFFFLLMFEPINCLHQTFSKLCSSKLTLVNMTLVLSSDQENFLLPIYSNFAVEYYGSSDKSQNFQIVSFSSKKMASMRRVNEFVRIFPVQCVTIGVLSH